MSDRHVAKSADPELPELDADLNSESRRPARLSLMDVERFCTNTVPNDHGYGALPPGRRRQIPGDCRQDLSAAVQMARWATLTGVRHLFFRQPLLLGAPNFAPIFRQSDQRKVAPGSLSRTLQIRVVAANQGHFQSRLRESADDH